MRMLIQSKRPKLVVDFCNLGINDLKFAGPGNHHKSRKRTRTTCVLGLRPGAHCKVTSQYVLDRTWRSGIPRQVGGILPSKFGNVINLLRLQLKFRDVDLLFGKVQYHAL